MAPGHAPSGRIPDPLSKGGSGGNRPGQMPPRYSGHEDAKRRAAPPSGYGRADEPPCCPALLPRLGLPGRNAEGISPPEGHPARLDRSAESGVRSAFRGLAAVHRPPGNGTCGYFYIRSPAPSGAGIGRTSGGPAGPLPDCGASAPDGGMPTGRNCQESPLHNGFHEAGRTNCSAGILHGGAAAFFLGSPTPEAIMRAWAFFRIKPVLCRKSSGSPHSSWIPPAGTK